MTAPTLPPRTATRADFRAAYRVWTTPAHPGGTWQRRGPRQARFAADLAPAEATEVVSGLAVPWRTVTERFGVPVHFTPETLRVPDDLAAVKLLVQHDDERPVGYALNADTLPDGLWLDAAVPTAGRLAADAMTDLQHRLREGLSVGVELDTETLDAIWDRMFSPAPPDPEDAEPVELAGLLREVSLVTIPQFLAARVHRPAATSPATRPAVPAIPPAAAAATPPPGRITTMTAPTLAAGVPAATLTPTSPGAAGAPTSQPPAPAVPVAAPVGMAELAAQLRPYLAAAPPAHPAAQWSGLGDLLLAAGDRATGARDAAGRRIPFALADQITANNPGVLPPTWLTEVVGIIARGRPAIEAFGGAVGAGDSGMSLTWPYYDGDLETLVDTQAAEKTEVTTGRVDIKSNTANLATYAGASDISYQLLRRSSPAYREIYGRILSLAYAARTDRQFSTDITAAAVAGPTWDGTTAESITAALFAASEQVDDAAGVPASVVLAAPDVFALIGGGLGLLPSAYGTQNVGGTAQANTLHVEVSGLIIRKGRHLAAGTLIVSTPEAATWREDGPFPVEADDVAVLGRDVGIWGMGMTTVTVPAALVKVTVAVPPPGSGRDDTGHTRRTGK